MADAQLTSLRRHPRAALAIRRAKGVGGLLGFVLVAVGGLTHGTPLGTVLAHALVGGIVANLIAWAAAVVIWRHLLAAQATTTVRQARARAEEQARQQPVPTKAEPSA